MLTEWSMFSNQEPNYCMLQPSCHDSTRANIAALRPIEDLSETVGFIRSRGPTSKEQVNEDSCTGAT